MKRCLLLSALLFLLLGALTAAAARLVCAPHPRGLSLDAQLREWRETVRFAGGALLE
jgi:hypothetical protein